MGQDQAKPKEPSPAGGSSPTTASLDEQYAKEKAKMVHVTTANDVVAETPLYEIEAERLLAQLQTMQVKPPLLLSSVEGNLLLKKEKMIEELSSSSSRLESHKLFHESLLVFLAQLQTLSLREGQVAFRREEEIVLRLQQYAQYAATLRHLAAKSVQQVNAISCAAKEALALETDIKSMAEELKGLCELALVLDASLSEEDREAVRAAVNAEKSGSP
jgi:hypothetical protein